MKKDLKDTKSAAAGRMKVGDIVTCIPITFFGLDNKQCRPRKGKVVYIGFAEKVESV